MKTILAAVVFSSIACAPTRPSVRVKSGVTARSAAEQLVAIVHAGAAADPQASQVSQFSDDHYAVFTTWHDVGRSESAIAVAKLAITVEASTVSVKVDRRECTTAQTICRLPTAGSAEADFYVRELPAARDPQVFDEKALVARIQDAIGQPAP